MNKYLISLLFLSITSFAEDDIEGYLQTHRYVNGNKPAYTDNTGDKALYGLDFEAKKYFANKFLHIMVGFDADSTNRGFSRIAGRAGSGITIKAIDLGFYHRSNHNLEHVALQPQRFISENYLYIRYNFKGSSR